VKWQHQTVSFRTDEEVGAALPGVVAHLKSGGLIAYPSDTVYGLGGAATVESLRDLAALKPRAQDAAFLLLASDNALVDATRLEWTQQARALRDRFWPGPLTLVLDARSSALPQQLRGPGGGIALRWTAHPGVSRLISAFGGVITSTSANAPGAPPAMDADSVRAYFGSEISDGGLLLLDGGVLPASQPSTLVDCTSDAARVLRHGAISVAVLKALLPDLRSDVREQ
jgi:L-threonylcarbamoyladenylate synthase